MDEKLLKLIGEVMKESLDALKSNFAEQLKTASEKFEDQIKNLTINYEDTIKTLQESIDNIQLEKGEQGEQGIQGEKGESVQLEDVVTALKSDTEFLTHVKGEKGDNGLSTFELWKQLPENLPVDLSDDEYAHTKFFEYMKGERGERGEQGTPGIQGEKGLDGESVQLEDVVTTLKADDEFMLKIKGEQGIPGEKGEKGDKGEDGIFTKAGTYNGEPVKKYDFIVHKGALWQNLMEDNDSVPSLENKSYQCIVEKPKDGMSIVPKGLYKEDEVYKENDVVMFNNASWIKNGKEAQELPGEGWFLLAKGTKGAKGDQGEKGEPGVVMDLTKDLELRIHKLEAKGIVYESTKQ